MASSAEETGAASTTSSKPQEVTLRKWQKAAAARRREHRCGGPGPEDAGVPLVPLRGNDLLRGMGDGGSRESLLNIDKRLVMLREAQPKVKLLWAAKRGADDGADAAPPSRAKT